MNEISRPPRCSKRPPWGLRGDRRRLVHRVEELPAGGERRAVEEEAVLVVLGGRPRRHVRHDKTWVVYFKTYDATGERNC